MGNQINDSRNDITLNYEKDINIKKSIFKAINTKYIIFQNKGFHLKIKNIDKNISYDIKYISKSPSSLVTFHPRLENIFLFADENIIKIYEVRNDGNECNENSTVNGHYKSTLLISFSQTDDKIFATFSLDITIRIWNLEYPFCICNISISNKIENMQIYKNFVFYYENNSQIIKYNYKLLQTENIINFEIDEYFNL